jgi:hypothetical protein
MEKIRTLVLSLDRRVRFAGVVTPKGEVIEGGFQEEAKPLLDQIKEQIALSRIIVNYWVTKRIFR